jgi:hypothetical protein
MFLSGLLLIIFSIVLKSVVTGPVMMLPEKKETNGNCTIVGGNYAPEAVRLETRREQKESPAGSEEELRGPAPAFASGQCAALAAIALAISSTSTSRNLASSLVVPTSMQQERTLNCSPTWNGIR